MSDPSATAAAIDAVWRIESARVIGALVRIVRDVGLAEDLAQEALVTAIERWPETGIPDNPGAWLVATAKNRAIDQLRRRRMQDRKHDALESAAPAPARPDVEAAIDDVVPDDVLRLILVACHPVLSREARAALTLRLVAGLTTDEIARAFLVAEPTIAQRIVRAKRTLAEAKVPYEVPRGDDLTARLTSVFEVVYLIFNEGYTATSGDHWMRPALCEEATRLARILAQLVPDDPEVHGLCALVELQASRLRARVTPSGEPILLLDQDRARWDQLLIHRGLDALARAETLVQSRGRPLGLYTLQAAIAACHARARRADDTDWARIVAIYDALVEVTGSPVVELNRAVAVAMAYGPAEALSLVDALGEMPALARYHLLPAVRGDLLVKLDRRDEARAEFLRAAELATNEREQDLMRARAAECAADRPRG